MGKNILTSIFGTHSQHEVKRVIPIVDRIEALEDDYKKLTDAELRAKTPEFKERLKAGETLDDILPEAYATVREAGARVLNMRHFRVQLIGGVILHQGRITEMRTGEGKTLVATLPSYLNALEGEGVHVVTVNDYLAKRDAEWMGQIHRFLGLSVGVILNSMDNDERRVAYNCDITYGTNNEFGFDYLRDNMVIYKKDLVQRGLHYAIIDEVDSVLIDEARTPLIISGQSGKSTKLYEAADIFARQIKRGTRKEMTKMDYLMNEEEHETGDYVVDEKEKAVNLTEEGVRKAERFFNVKNLSDPENLELQHNINLALKAHAIMIRDKDYVVKDDEVLIVDEFTGRIMPGRRFSDGLHQAIEAKEHVKVKRESKTLATITFQNFFNKYDKKCGMTGTALTEEREFREIYGMDVVEVPTNKPVQRKDYEDAVYKTKKEKFDAVIEDIEETHKKGQPVLVGTINIDTSEYLSELLDKKNIKHSVLNAKHHEEEAHIVAQAGRLGMVTIATNMAGRGTDILLGGNPDDLAEDFASDKSFLRRLGNDDDYQKRFKECKADLKKLIDMDEPDLLLLQKWGKGILFFNGLKVDLAGKYNGEINEAVSQEAERICVNEAADAEAERICSEEKEKVVSLGGLKIIGTERHESRRIDNQLRGRAGRQGDPGESIFYISLEDDLMRLFGSEHYQAVFNALPDGQRIEHKMLSRAIEGAQKKIEGNNFGIRKNLLEFDRVNNDQRERIYAERRKVLDGENMRSTIFNMMMEFIENSVNACISDEVSSKDWDFDELNHIILPVVPMDPIVYEDEELKGMKKNDLLQDVKERAGKVYEAKEGEFPEPEQIREVERVILLRVIDTKWMSHIDDMDQLRQGIGLQAYGQRNPVVEYNLTGLDMFNDMIDAIGEDTVRLLLHIQVEQKVERQQVAKASGTNKDETAVNEPKKRKHRKIMPNDPCPCGSGKKYKYCHGRPGAPKLEGYDD
ncbi:MAG: preprotein translocase subunit SecA [Lachnospiraceae bacterium]|nr:preprotein translocase subunit SecA [Lachnospiraceae bacterium]